MHVWFRCHFWFNFLVGNNIFCDEIVNKYLRSDSPICQSQAFESAAEKLQNGRLLFTSQEEEAIKVFETVEVTATVTLPTPLSDEQCDSDNFMSMYAKISARHLAKMNCSSISETTNKYSNIDIYRRQCGYVSGGFIVYYYTA